VTFGQRTLGQRYEILGEKTLRGKQAMDSKHPAFLHKQKATLRKNISL